ncbi:MAG: RNase H-like domain-containing protein [Candidatus Thiodiazotropha endolucinida]|nr:DDE-type integrase/transposase/recombinase [Candidatus Thiodiazotropha taylori]MCW4262728.1 RNase H-like domain-containing protein [Candidatus Thiodiazotropha endolucinida]
MQSKPGSSYNADEVQLHKPKHLHMSSEGRERPHLYDSAKISLYQISQTTIEAQKEMVQRESDKSNSPSHSAVPLQQSNETSLNSLSPNHESQQPIFHANANGNIVQNTRLATEKESAVGTEKNLTYTPNDVDSNLPETLQDLLVRSSEHLNAEETEQLAKLLLDYQDVFARSSSDLGRCDRVQHTINTGNAIPVRQPARRLPFGKRLTEQAEIKKMLDRGVIEPSNSPWSSPVVLVTKKDGSIRFCVDYRVLNGLTVKDAYPIPRVDECLDALSGCKWYSSMDLNSGFWQVGLHPEDRQKSAFATSLGLFQFTVMPFGLANSPSTFERLKEDVLRGLQWEELLLYMDDIVSPSVSVKEGLQRLRNIFDRLRAANLKLKPSKCSFFQKKIRFLGHIVSESGVATDPEKLSAIKDWPIPRTAKQVKSFLGLCSYYRRYVKDFAKIARPLHLISDKKAKFTWNDQCQEAFEHLKKALMSSDILSYPIPGLRFILDTDASDVSVGAVLSQEQDGRERVIAYMSKAINKHEQLYCTTRKELLAVIYALRSFHSYLYGQPVLLRTDNSAVSWLRQLKNPTGQVARWIQEVETYNLTIQHRAGLKHSNADALSRRPCKVCKHQEMLSAEAKAEQDTDQEVRLKNTGLSLEIDSLGEISGATSQIIRDLHTTSVSQGTEVLLQGWTKEDIHQAQLEDPDIGPLLTAIETSSSRPNWDQVSSGQASLKTLWRQWDRLTIVDNLLYCGYFDKYLEQTKNLLVVPKCKCADLLRNFHDIPTAGHLGSDKMLYRLKNSFYWPGMKEDVLRYCNSCDKCIARKTPSQPSRAPLKPYQVGEPMEKIAMDILGPLPVSEKGNRFILVLADCFTKWTEAYAIPNQESSTLVEVIVNEFICRFGTPLQILTDQGTNFQSKLFSEVCNFLKIDKINTSSMRPQANGTVERFNRTLQTMLTSFCENDQKAWDRHLPQLMMAYRASQHSTTHLTPNLLMLGREAVLPAEAVTGLPYSHQDGNYPTDEDQYVLKLRERFAQAHDVARKNLRIHSEYRKRRYDLKARKSLLEPGQAVWLYNPTRRVGVSTKLTCKWKGPYVVIRRLDDVTYLVKNSPKQKAKVYHVDRLLPYQGRNLPTWFDKGKLKGKSQ